MVKFRPGGFFDLLFNIELKKVGVKIFREISYFSSPIELSAGQPRPTLEFAGISRSHDGTFHKLEYPVQYLVLVKLGSYSKFAQKLILAGTAGTVPWDTNPTESRHLWDASPGTGTEICRDSRDWDCNAWDSPGRLESRDSNPGTENPWDSWDCPMPIPDLTT